MSRALRLILLSAVTIVTASCSDVFSPNSRVTGRWYIETYNGQPLPALFDASGFTIVELVSDEMYISSNGRYTDSYTFRVEGSSGDVRYLSYRDDGYWDQVNSTITFTDSRTGEVASGSIAGGRLTLLLNGDAYVYRR